LREPAMGALGGASQAFTLAARGGATRRPSRLPLGRGQGSSRPLRWLRAGGPSSETSPAEGTPSSLGRVAKKVDADLSSRWLALDPLGYFIIRLDRDAGTLILDHYTNTVDKDGVACDPDTGEPIPCAPGTTKRLPTHVWTGRTAKEVCVQALEAEGAAHVRWDAPGAEARPPASKLGSVLMPIHAAYLGRELQKAEDALIHGTDYWQD